MSSAPLRLLLVEDDNHIGRIISLALSELGVPFDLDTAVTAEAALEMWRRQAYDLLLTDYNLRAMNGLALIQTLKREGSQAPMIIFTAYDTPRLQREAREAGVSAYIPKPFFFEDFLSQVRSHLPQRAVVSDPA